MPQADRDRESDVPKPWQPRFGIGGLMLMMFVCSVVAASGYYFTQFLRGGRQYQLAFVLFTLAAPLLLVVVISAGLRVLAWWGEIRRR